MQDTAKTQLRRQRENTYIHKQRLSAMCTCIRRTYTYKDAYWLNRKTVPSQWPAKVLLCLPATMEIKLFHVFGS